MQWVAVLSALTFLLSLAAISYFSSPPSDYPKEQQTSTETKQKDQSEKKHSLRGFIRFMLPDAISIFTFWLVLATVGLGLIAVYQISFLERAERISAKSVDAAKQAADATRGAVTLSDKTAERQLRAYVFIDASEIQDFFPGQKMKAVFRIKNFGDTPATKVLAGASVYFGAGKLPQVPIKKLPGILPPKNWMDLTLKVENAVTQSEYDAVVAGKAVLFVKGEISYVDVFDQPRTTEFSQYFAGGVAIPQGAVLSLSNQEEGNNYK